MSKVNVDEIQVGDLVGFDSYKYKGQFIVGYVTDIKISNGKKEFWGHFGGSRNPGRKEFLRECSVDYHWKVINFEEETKMDELKVYTGKETLRALLEGKTLKYRNSHNQLIKYESNQFMTKDGDSQWRQSLVTANGLLTIKMTEVVTPQVGDWVRVTCESGNVYVGQIKEYTAGGAYADWNGDKGGFIHFENNGRSWEILSPEQVSEYKREQAFTKVGRKLNEFRSGDIVYVEATGETAIVISNNNEKDALLHVFNQTGKGLTAKPHQLTPIAFAEQQVDLS